MQNYILEQDKQDQIGDILSKKEHEASFKGGKHPSTVT